MLLRSKLFYCLQLPIQSNARGGDQNGSVGITVFDTEEKQLCLGKSKAQLPGRLAELALSQAKLLLFCVKDCK